MIRVNLLPPRAPEFNPAVLGINMQDRKFFGPDQCPITGIGLAEKKVPSNLPDLEFCSVRDITSPTSTSISIVAGSVDNALSTRVLAYLADAEAREPQPWFRDDIRISWLTVLHCAEGIADPWRFAFWQYLGATPEKIIPQLTSRAEAHAAMELAKKPVQSESLPRKEKSA